MLISSIALAAAAASSGPSAIFIPPDFPRLPASTCALITEGPMLATAALTSSGVLQTTPFGINTAAGSRTCCLAAYSSKFICDVPIVRTEPNAGQKALLQMAYLRGWGPRDG